MKSFLLLLLSFTFLSSFGLKAQDLSSDLSTYYQVRAKEDAAYEQSVKFKDNADEEDFWKDQKRYEKELKRRNKKAFVVYMNSKKDAYTTHSKNCSDACQHNENFHRHTFYYHSYEKAFYPRRLVMGAQLPVDTPRVSSGNF